FPFMHDLALLRSFIYLRKNIVIHQKTQKEDGGFVAPPPAGGGRVREGGGRCGLMPSPRPSPTGRGRKDYEGIAMDCFSSSSFSTTPGSASVEVSPRLLVSPAAILRKIRRIILPERVFGSESVQCST